MLYNITDLSSDHTPVKLVINGETNQIPIRSSLTSGPINWTHYKKYLNNNTKLGIPLKTAQDLEQASATFVEMIQSAAKLSSQPSNNYPTTSNTIMDKYPLPSHINVLLRQKRKARAKWQISGYPNDKRIFNNLTNKLKRQLQNHKNQSYHNYISNLNPTNGSLWKATKKILRHIESTPPIRRPDNSKITDDVEKSNVFAEHLATVFKPNIIQTNPQHSARVFEFLDSPLPVSMPAKSTTPNDVFFYIKHLKSGKAPGHDLITAPFLKQLPPKTIILLSYIFNSILRLSYMPSIWKHAQIILIHKPGKPPENPSSYRPISLLSVVGKLFEKILLKRITKIATDNKIIPDFQFGFKSKHSTIHQLHRVVDQISLAFESKKICVGIFLDIAQAFDRVWHPGLLFKLKSFLPAPYYLLIKSYLNQRTFVTKINGALSNSQIATAGVPQGSDIAPFLFNIFSSDLPLNDNTLLGTFADDTAILATDKDPIQAAQKIQNHLTVLNTWFHDWKILVNPSKSSQITFTLRSLECPATFIGNAQIPSSTQTNYLGLILDKRLTWGPHLKNKRKALNSRLHLLRPLLRSKLSLKTKRTIYMALLRPIWYYGIQLWGSAKPSNTKTIQAFQSICLRLISGAPWYITNESLHKDICIPTLNSLAKITYKKTHKTFSTHPNPLIIQLSSNQIPGNPPRRLKRNWCRDLLSL